MSPVSEPLQGQGTLCLNSIPPCSDFVVSCQLISSKNNMTVMSSGWCWLAAWTLTSGLSMWLGFLIAWQKHSKSKCHKRTVAFHIIHFYLLLTVRKVVQVQGKEIHTSTTWWEECCHIVRRPSLTEQTWGHVFDLSLNGRWERCF